MDKKTENNVSKILHNAGDQKIGMIHIFIPYYILPLKNIE